MDRVLNRPPVVNGVYDENTANVVTARAPASAYLVINSRDRYFNASPTQGIATYQPWNDFLIQKAQSLVPSFAKRISVNEIRFPWFIPNITDDNRRIILMILDSSSNTQYVDVRITSGQFYTPQALIAAINAEIASQVSLNPALAAGDAPVFSYNSGQVIVATGTNGNQFAFAAISRGAGPINSPIPSPGPLQPFIVQTSYAYENAPNLWITLGMPFEYMTTTLATPKYFSVAVSSNYTTCLYTDYVDIVSDRLSRYTDARDSGSGDFAKTSVVCRLYLADEVSLPQTDVSGNIIPIGCTPFIIHRQFASPKSFMWEAKAFVGDLDFSVYDQFGRLVYMPINAFAGRPFSYPDYQITMLASEN